MSSEATRAPEPSVSRVLAVALDCYDLNRMSAFWCGVLGSSVVGRWRDAVGKEYVEVGLPGSTKDVVLLLQPGGERKLVKNRMHLDLAPTGSSQRAEVTRLVALGATVLADDPEQPWVVLADPECNEFCVLPPRDEPPANWRSSR